MTYSSYSNRQRSLPKPVITAIGLVLAIAVIAIIGLNLSSSGATPSTSAKPQEQQSDSTNIDFNETPQTSLNLGKCDTNEPLYGGITSFSCFSENTEIVYEHFADIESLKKAIRQYGLEPADEELENYTRKGLSSGQTRLMTANIEKLIIINIVSELNEIEPLEQWLEGWLEQRREAIQPQADQEPQKNLDETSNNG